MMKQDHIKNETCFVSFSILNVHNLISLFSLDELFIFDTKSTEENTQ